MFSSKALPLSTPSTLTSGLHPLRLGTGNHALTKTNTTTTTTVNITSKNNNKSNKTNHNNGNTGASPSTSISTTSVNNYRDTSRPQAHGPCKFILLHPTQQSQQCSCQSYHHNLTAPGSICDCGHQACYHDHNFAGLEPAQGSPTLSHANEQVLLERTKLLEEALQRERQSRKADMLCQRKLWESDIRMLREALAPLYKAEAELRRKLIDLEDRVDGNCDEQVQLKDQLMALDNTHMLLEKRLQDMEARSKRRRIGQPNGSEDPHYLVNGSSIGNGTRTISHHPDEHSVRSSSSRALSPQSSLAAPIQEPEEPRSSGILNLVDPLRLRPYATTPVRPPPPPPPPGIRRTVSYEREEPRSSGFLALDLAERDSTTTSNNSKIHANAGGRAASQPHAEAPATDRHSPPHYSRSNPDQSTDRRSPSFPLPALLPPPLPPPPPPATATALAPHRPSPPPHIPIPHKHNLRHVHPVLVDQFYPRKRKYMTEHLALDVLADVSMASPLMP